MRKNHSLRTLVLVAFLAANLILNSCSINLNTNNSGNADSSKISTENSKDNAPPTIQLIGSNPASTNLVKTKTMVEDNNSYADPGAVAFDDAGLNVTSNIKVTGQVDKSKIGSYVLTYTVKDKSENITTLNRTVNVVDKIDPLTIEKFVTPLLIPSAMPKTQIAGQSKDFDYYEIIMKQFEQQILPNGMPKTTVWGYGSATDPKAIFNAPSLTIEAKANRPVKVKWINGLMDKNGNYLPHILPVDQTLHWANPTSGDMGKDMAGKSQSPYVGPVPIVTHVHGAHVNQESDGYPEAWYLPSAKNIPIGTALFGSFYDIYKRTAESGSDWDNGYVIYDYQNDQRDTTLWYHDHTMGMTRTNVYAGPAGFYLIRGNEKDKLIDKSTGKEAVLPGADQAATTNDKVYEIPIVMQDRTFNTDGSLFYPDSRYEFDEFDGPYSPISDIAPIWNPEFFGDSIVVNGNTWPFLNVEKKRYRFRFLNGSQARVFILSLKNKTNPSINISFWQIGSDGGFLDKPYNHSKVIMGPAERADVIVDFTKANVGDKILLSNVGPDMPYNGEKQEIANPKTTGQIMEFRVVKDLSNSPDLSTLPSQLLLPKITSLIANQNPRQLSLNEEMSETLMNPDEPDEEIGPKAALLGTVMKDPKTGLVIKGVPQMWSSDITENILNNSTEVWEIYNYTADAHPIHLHLVEFQVVGRQSFNIETGAMVGKQSSAQVWETGFKDTVLAYPGQITRIKAKFDKVGRYVWHCHILEHEDNEMMRPFTVK